MEAATALLALHNLPTSTVKKRKKPSSDSPFSPGTRVSVYWENEDEWFSGVCHNTTTRGTYVVYDDGDRRYHNFEKEEFRFEASDHIQHTCLCGKTYTYEGWLRRHKQTCSVFQDAQIVPDPEPPPNPRMNDVAFREYMKTVVVCPICMDTCNKPRMITKCGHWMCTSCLESHLNVKKDCPICRHPLPNMRHTVVHSVLQSIIDRV